MPRPPVALPSSTDARTADLSTGCSLLFMLFLIAAGDFVVVVVGALPLLPSDNPLDVFVAYIEMQMGKRMSYYNVQHVVNLNIVFEIRWA